MLGYPAAGGSHRTKECGGITARAKECAVAPGTGEAVLELKGIVRRFPGGVALDRVDFSVRPAEIHMWAGQSGAGKTVSSDGSGNEEAPSAGADRPVGCPGQIRRF